MNDYGAVFLGLVLIGIVMAIIGLVLMIPLDRQVVAERRAASLDPAYALPAQITTAKVSQVRAPLVR